MLEPSDPTAGLVPDDDAVVVVRGLVERSTRLTLAALDAVVDAVGGVVDRTPPAGGRGPEDHGVRDLVAGAVLATQDRVLDGTERALRGLSRVAPVGRRVARLPLVAPAVGALGRRVDALVERGAAERAEARVDGVEAVERTVASVLASEQLSDTVDRVVEAILPGILESALPDVLDRLAGDVDALLPLVQGVIDPVLDTVLPQVLDRLADQPELLLPVVERLLDPILTSALPQVLNRLNEEPEVVRELVLGQSVSIAGEMAGVVRSRGALADDVVERVVRRLTFRRAALPVPPRELEAGGEGETGGGRP